MKTRCRPDCAGDIAPGLVLPDVPHLVEPLGPMRMQVEFYNQFPDL
jgi:hypothetical protein